MMTVPTLINATTSGTRYVSKPGPIGSWEELALRQLLLRVIALLIKGYSYRGIAREMGIARTTVMRMKPEATHFGILGNGLPR